MEREAHDIESLHFAPSDSSFLVPAGGYVEQHFLGLGNWIERDVKP